ncbi:MAG TPA: hypothetical protein VFM18_24370 [Methanosarcina sp.]|nr:hypothetical protein [Methanosarcina sp.]
MQRYSIVEVSRAGECWQKIRQHEHGSWIRYEQVKELTDKLESRIKTLGKQLQIAKDFIEIDCHDLKGEMYDLRIATMQEINEVTDETE